MEKATLGFLIYKIWFLKCFAGTFRRAQTLKLGGVVYLSMLFQVFYMCYIHSTLGILPLKQKYALNVHKLIIRNLRNRYLRK